MSLSLQPFDDLIFVMRLVSSSCEFDGGSQCEVKMKVENLSQTHGGRHAQLYIQCAPDEAERAMIGDQYIVHLRRIG